MDIDPILLVEPAATRVRDPLSGRSAWLAKIVRDPRMDGDVLVVDLIFKHEHKSQDREGMTRAFLENLHGLGYKGQVRVSERVEAPQGGGPKKPPVPGMEQQGIGPHGGPVVKKKIEGVRHIFAVASGKGGVGKSTIAANLAIALQRLGHKVGLMDADIYGPSVPRMMDVNVRPMVDDRQFIVPPTSYGVKCVSAGMLVPENEAIIWRGPMIMNLLRQFLQQTAWGDLDYLVVDLPPGTGDAQLTLIQGCDLSGAIVVTTPQAVALGDAVRGVTMFRKLDVPLLGLVEIMSWYELPDGTRDFVFGEGGGVRLAEKEKTDLLAQIPLRTSLRRSGDEGLPAALADDATGKAFADLARKVVAKLP